MFETERFEDRGPTVLHSSWPPSVTKDHPHCLVRVRDNSGADSLAGRSPSGDSSVLPRGGACCLCLLQTPLGVALKNNPLRRTENKNVQIFAGCRCGEGGREICSTRCLHLKRGKSQINNLSSCLGKLGGKNQNKPKASRKKEMIKSRNHWG